MDVTQEEAEVPIFRHVMSLSLQLIARWTWTRVIKPPAHYS